MWPFILAGLQLTTSYLGYQNQRDQALNRAQQEITLGARQAQTRNLELQKMLDQIIIESSLGSSDPNSGSALAKQRQAIFAKGQDDQNASSDLKYNLNQIELALKNNRLNLLKNSLFAGLGAWQTTLATKSPYASASASPSASARASSRAANINSGYYI